MLLSKAEKARQEPHPPVSVQDIRELNGSGSVTAIVKNKNFIEKM